eukprot:TRINITY_DN9793_c0_g2_i1.p1 TRINITY_DN9793_c0_g2~~TRINITY_DN9793_c0_g2_i1.p1  ORF type:complete len:297 (+),score=61.93 TRINITY_DN9793_c0_g2_i1:633-1523(+)
MFEIPCYLSGKQETKGELEAKVQIVEDIELEKHSQIVKTNIHKTDTIKKKQGKKKKTGRRKSELNAKLSKKSKATEEKAKEEPAAKAIPQKKPSNNTNSIAEQQTVKEISISQYRPQRRPKLQVHNATDTKPQKAERASTASKKVSAPSTERWPEKYNEPVIHDYFTPRPLPVYRRPRERKVAPVYYLEEGMFDVNWEIEAKRGKLSKREVQKIQASLNKYTINSLKSSEVPPKELIPTVQGNKTLSQTGNLTEKTAVNLARDANKPKSSSTTLDQNNKIIISLLNENAETQLSHN